MATKDTGQGARGVSRRDFLKTAAAAGAVVGCGLDFAFDAEKALAYEGDPTNYQITSTTCPYCSASCGQRVVVDKRAGSPTLGKVIDMYGDFESPFNSGGLCSKGAGTWQLVTNSRRIGAWEGPHPVPNMNGATDNIFAFDGANTEVAYKRLGNNNWSAIDLNTALKEIVEGDAATDASHQGLKYYREQDTRFWDPANGKYNSKSVAFFGSSHMNNESNYIYRKIIANFGTSNVEHQARI